MKLPMVESHHARRISVAQVIVILAMLFWLGAVPIGFRLVTELRPVITGALVISQPVVLGLAFAALSVPYLGVCAIARRRPGCQATAAAAAACAAVGGYALLDGALRTASPPSAMTMLLGESAWVIARRALLSLLYLLLVAWAVPWLASARRIPLSGRLGLDEWELPGLLVALGAAGIVTLPWPVTGALGDSLTSLNLLCQAATTVVPEVLIFWGVIYSVLKSMSAHRRVGALVCIVVYAASALGGVLPAGGLSELGAAIQRLVLALLLWELRALGSGALAPLAAAYLSTIIPRLFVDPRDAIASGMPEPQHIAAGSVGLVAMLVLSLAVRFGGPVLAAIRRRWGPGDRGMRLAAIGAPAGVWAVWFALYVLLGTPGFYNHGFLIVLSEQADIRAAEAVTTRDARLSQVYHTLVETAETTQAPLRKELDALGAPYRPYYLINMIRVDGYRWLMGRFNERPDVAQVLLNPSVREYPRRVQLPYGGDAEQPAGELQANLRAIRVEASWALGITGQGVVVAGQDTGYDWEHPALIRQYRGSDGITGTHNYNWHDAWDATDVPFDDGTHGTHTMGIVVGDDRSGNRTGVAPEAQWIGCRNMRRGLGNPGSYAECMEFFLAPYPHDGDPFRDGDVAMAPHVVNNSWACPDFEGCQPDTLKRALDVLRSGGIMMVVSAGNEGPSCGSVSIPPAAYDSTFSVGATDDDATVESFSSRGPASGLIKPDVTAPGGYVRSSVAGGGYGYGGGTSMAGPHVAGMVALLWSANPDLIGDIDGTEALICRTAVPRTVESACGADEGSDGGLLSGLLDVPACACGDAVGVPNNVYGCGFIDAGAAVRVALGD